MQSPTTPGHGDGSDPVPVNTDAGASHTGSSTTSTSTTTLSLPLHVPMAVQTYYEAMCKNQPLARRHLIVDELWLMRGRKRGETYEFVAATVKHTRGLDISNRLECLIFEKSLYSPIRSLSSSSPEHIVSQCREACFSVGNHRMSAHLIRRLTFYKSSDSNIKKLCLLEDLSRLITIICNTNSHLYSTDIDASYWFAETIMETAQAIFPIDDDDDKKKIGWLKRTFRRSDKPLSEWGRQIVAAYRDDKKKNPIPTASGNETETLEYTDRPPPSPQPDNYLYTKAKALYACKFYHLISAV
jgi:hypothetical protein